MSNLQDNKPFTDGEIPSAMAAVVADPLFPEVAKYLYGDKPIDEVRNFLLSIKSVRQLQEQVMRSNLDRMLELSQSSFSYNISPALRKDTAYLFVSNHRDIVLDAMLLQCALVDEGYETSQVIFGTNLLSIPLMSTVGRANKMVAIERGGSPKEFYNNLSILSHYMREVITQKGESVWIAQGNGRSKDGNDTTDPAIVKMFAMSSSRPLAEAVAELNPVPVSVSYEIEPCDMQKAIESAVVRIRGHYEKSDKEDFESVLSGIKDCKGRIHIEVGTPFVAEQITKCGNDAHAVAQMFDGEIRRNYKVDALNYVAHDLRDGSTTFADKYTAEQREFFVERQQALRQLTERAEMGLSNEEQVLAQRIFLDIYATPIDNKVSK